MLPDAIVCTQFLFQSKLVGGATLYWEALCMDPSLMLLYPEAAESSQAKLTLELFMFQILIISEALARKSLLPGKFGGAHYNLLGG